MSKTPSTWWPLIKLLPVKTNFRFMRFAKVYAGVSLVATIAAVFLTLFPFEPPCAGLNCGVDFRGGTVLEITSRQPIDLGRVRETLNARQLGDVQVQAFGSPQDALVRFETPEGQNPAVTVEGAKRALVAAIGPLEFKRTEVVGPKVSGELFRNGVLALALGVGMMMVYIWFRFGLTFGIGAAAALIHDVLLTFGLFAVTNMEFSLNTVAAILTIIGYSVNDTVVVLDRVRENLRKYKRMPLSEVIDLSINETLSRTAITGVTGLMALGVLAAFGGETLFGFSIAMIFGIVVGTYSSFFVAAVVLMWLGVKRGEDAEVLKPLDARP
ncbi:MAG: protein translocase subunit SecF [Phenylobacterium sp.]|uniref:protein translocase subunit SecF n=1 Tax=Phenylobacterium sp. TaxID=1871053 RepID=UPI001A4B8771|nr:protein translocase subunit SecF [Phenylobacterium sp.]MBL8772151.1 protein translocase subunit SecF [Phenylobacterium sp.]